MPGKTKSTIMIDTDLWKRLKVISVINEFEISELVEEALREKLARMQQLEQYAEYNDVESLRYKPRITPQQQMHPPVTPTGDSGALPQLSPTTTAPSTTEQQPQILQEEIRLPGIEFPAHKSRIVKCVEEGETPAATKYFKFISDRKYKNKSDLENELSNRARVEGTTIVFKTDNRKLRKVQYKGKSLEQKTK